MIEKTPLITKCKDLILDSFISCICDEDYSVLGTGYTQDELIAAWQTIRSEYIALMEDTVLLQAEAYKTEILYWQLQYQSVVVSVRLLRNWHDDAVVKGLKDKGYYFGYDPSDVEKYNKDLDAVLNQAKTTLIHIANTKHELETLAKEMGKDSRPMTRLGMMSNIMQFSKFMGHAINTKETNVEAYIAIRNLYYKELNKIKK